MKRITATSIVLGTGLLMEAKPASAAGPEDSFWGPVNSALLAVIIAILLLVIWIMFRKMKNKGGFGETLESASTGAAQQAPKSIPKAKLIDVSGVTDRKAFDLDKLLNEIGRDPINDISIPKETISSLHAGIECKEGYYYLIDQKSSNGSFLNGKKITPGKPFRLKDGDRIKFDIYEFTFLLPQQRPVAGQTVIKLRDESPEAEPQTPAAAPVKAPPHAAAESPPQADMDLGSAAPDGATRIKSIMCPNHSSRKATELCSICKNAYCLQCMSIEHQKTVCLACAAKMKK